MTNQRALTQVRNDLAAGRQSAAVRRLRALLAADPGDTTAYRLLTEIHRTAGNPVEAGRWGYLTGDATPDEVSAFEQAHPQPWVRLRLLGKSLDPQRLPNDAARARLADLHQQVSEATVPLQRDRRSAGATTGSVTFPARPAAGAGPKSTGPAPPQREAIPTQREAKSTALVKATARVTARATAGVRAAAIGLGRPPGGTASAPAAVPGPRVGPATRPVPQTDRGRAAASRSRAETTRNYLILGLLIVAGMVGSVAAVGGIRAVFGVKNWSAPVEAIISAIGRLFTD